MEGYMTRRIFILACILVACSLVAVSADPCVGYWKSIDDETGEVTAFWRIYIERDMLFGEIVKIADKPDSTIAEKVEPTYSDFPIAGDLSKRTVLNTPWIYNLTRRSEGHWRRGYIIDPKDGKRYSSEIIFHPADGRKYMVDTLEVKRKVLIFSRSQYWEKSSLAEVQAHVN